MHLDLVCFRLALSVVISSGAMNVAAAQSVTVTTLNDVVDFGGAQQTTDLPGPDGRVSFREALTATNNTPGGQTILFAIPQSEWWLYNNLALLRLEDGVFFVSDDHTVIDFSSQAAFTGDTNPNGREVGIYGLEPNGWGTPAIWISADHCTIIGLGVVDQRGDGVRIEGNYNRVIGCHIEGTIHAAVNIGGGWNDPPATGNVIGGTLPGEGNFLSGGSAGVRIEGPAEDNVVIGNHLSGRSHGVWIIGSDFQPIPMNNRIGGPTAAERNIIEGAGYSGSEGFPSGDQIEITRAHGTIIQGNYIGLLADGVTTTTEKGARGVEMTAATGTIIRDNVIAGMRATGSNHYAGQLFGVGISIRGGGQGTVIQNNILGASADGSVPLPNLNNITVESFPGEDSVTDVLIGGESSGDGNLIVHAERQSVSVGAQVIGVSVLGNSIHDNAELGIDLRGNTPGVTPNDPADADTGPNNQQNFPTLIAAESTASGSSITGTLDSVPNESFRLEFFASPTCDPSGFGEGERFLGFQNVATDAQGLAAFNAVVSAPLTPGESVTGTATRMSTGDSSEFSACVTATAGSKMVGDVDEDGHVDFTDLNMLLSAYNQTGGPGWIAEDLDDDGDVDFADLNLLLGNYNAGS